MKDAVELSTKINELVAEVRGIASSNRDISELVIQAVDEAEFLSTELDWVAPAIGFEWQNQFRVITMAGIYGKGLPGIRVPELPILPCKPFDTLRFSESEELDKICLDLLFLPNRHAHARPEFSRNTEANIARDRWFKANAEVIAVEAARMLNEKGPLEFYRSFVENIKNTLDSMEIGAEDEGLMDSAMEKLFSMTKCFEGLTSVATNNVEISRSKSPVVQFPLDAYAALLLLANRFEVEDAVLTFKTLFDHYLFVTSVDFSTNRFKDGTSDRDSIGFEQLQGCVLIALKYRPDSDLSARNELLWLFFRGVSDVFYDRVFVSLNEQVQRGKATRELDHWAGHFIKNRLHQLAANVKERSIRTQIQRATTIFEAQNAFTRFGSESDLLSDSKCLTQSELPLEELVRSTNEELLDSHLDIDFGNLTSFQFRQGSLHRNVLQSIFFEVLFNCHKYALVETSNAKKVLRCEVVERMSEFGSYSIELSNQCKQRVNTDWQKKEFLNRDGAAQALIYMAAGLERLNQGEIHQKIFDGWYTVRLSLTGLVLRS